jgi:cobalt-zinc-cadmium efflux system protein
MHVHAASPSTTSSNLQHGRRLGLVLGLTTAYLLVEIAAGLWTGSLALLADAGHMLTDAGGLALALLAIRFAARDATPSHTYGYLRLEILAALTNAVVLIGVSLYILYEAWARLFQPPAVSTGPMLVVACAGLLVNLAGVLLLRGGSGASLNVKGAYFEVLSDTLSSAAVIAAAVAMAFTGWYFLDPLISAAIGLFILPRTWGLLMEAVSVLLEGTPKDVDLEAMRAALATLPGVQDVHDLHVWSLTSGVHAMSAHLVRAPHASPDDVLARAQTCVTKQFDLAHVTLQVEPPGWEEAGTHR